MAVRGRPRRVKGGEVLAAALDTFREKGFAGTRMEDIAVRAGVSKGTLYLYYPSKEAVFEALVRENLLPSLAVAEATVAASMDRPADIQLMALLLILQDVLADPRRIAIPRLVLAEAGNFPDLARFYRTTVVERGLGLVGGILRRGVERGELRPLDPDQTARLFMAPVLMAAVWQTTFAPVEEEQERFDPAVFLRHHADLFLRAIRAPRPASPPSGQPAGQSGGAKP